jgi:RNA polymerase sigma factor (sigma-70 family)
MLFIAKKYLPDSDIISGIGAGGSNRRKFETQLFEKYHGLIKEGIRKHRLSEDECVSAYSDTIISIIDNILKDKFEGRSELKTYIYQIFSNKCVDQIRKNTTNKASVHGGLSYEEIDIPLPDESKSVIQKMMIESDLQLLYQKLGLIGEKCKQMILLWGEAYSDEEIAVQLGYNTAAVAKTSRLRCLEKLKENY